MLAFDIVLAFDNVYASFLFCHIHLTRGIRKRVLESRFQRRGGGGGRFSPLRRRVELVFVTPLNFTVQSEQKMSLVFIFPTICLDLIIVLKWLINCSTVSTMCNPKQVEYEIWKMHSFIIFYRTYFNNFQICILKLSYCTCSVIINHQSRLKEHFLS